MLVLSRKENESVVFPRLGISVEITRVSGRTVSVRVTAPKEIRVLRGELVDAEDLDSSLPQPSDSETKHALRNRLNKANLAMKLVSKQLALGRVEDAETSLAIALGALHDLDVNSESTPVPRSFSPKTGSRKRALLVEDDPNERALLASYLRASGFEVDTAEDGQAALEYLTQQKPDAVVMDMEMPRLSGQEAIREIRADDNFADIKLFIVSGMERCKNVPIGDRGVQRWFQKPLCPEDLVQELSTSLN